MIDKNSITYIMLYFVKTYLTNIYMYYSFCKMTKHNIKNKKIYKFIVLNIIITILCTYVEYKINTTQSIVFIYLIFSIVLANITKNKIGYSLIVSVISYAICTIAMIISAIVNFIPYNLLYKNNYYLNTLSVVGVQFIIIYGFFKIKRFSNGFGFLNRKLNKDITDTIVSFVCVTFMVVIAVMSTLYQGYKTATQDLFILLGLLAITMFIMIQRTLTTHYKQTQLLKTLDEYKAEIDEKNKEIERLSNEKYNTSRIRHEFYNRQKALELMVKQTIGDSKTEVGEIGSENILKVIENLSEEYSKECDKVKQLPELKKTGIFEIDSMFKYMQNECANNNISFKLRVIGEIYPLVNNIIPKDRLETLIGDHIRDSINAINNEGVENREILVLLGKKDKKYELSIHDTGIEFEIDTLLKLGAMRVTTCENKGGTGIGFMTTFETLKQTGASLIIIENEPSYKRYYTKSVTIRFDGKQQYKVVSYRAKEIEKTNDRKDMIINKLNNIN